MGMSSLLKLYVAEILREMKNARVPTQLRPPGGEKEKSEKEKDSEEDNREMDEMSGGGAIATSAMPLGLTPEDTKGPGFPRKSKKRSDLARWT